MPIDEMRGTALLLNALSFCLEGSERLVDKIIDKAKENKRLAEFNKEIGGNTVTANNCAIYAAEGYSWKTAMREMHEHNIPCLAFSNDKNSTIVLTVPQQYREQSDRIIKETMEKVQATQKEWKEFTEDNKNNAVTVHENITKPEYLLIKEKLKGSGLGYCVQPQQDGNYRLFVPAERDIAMVSAITFAKMQLQKNTGEKAAERLAAKESIIEDYSQPSGNKNSVTVIYDAAIKGKNPYVINDQGLHRIEDNNLVCIIKNKDRHFDRKFAGIVNNIENPIVKTIDAKAFEKIREEKYKIENVFSREEIMKAKERMSNDDKDNGRTSQADAFAAQIIALRTAITNTDNAEQVNRMNTASQQAQTNVETDTEEMARAPELKATNVLGERDLIRICREMGYSENEIDDVVAFVNEGETIPQTDILDTAEHFIKNSLMNSAHISPILAAKIATDAVIAYEECNAETSIDAPEYEGVNENVEHDENEEPEIEYEAAQESYPDFRESNYDSDEEEID